MTTVTVRAMPYADSVYGRSRWYGELVGDTDEIKNRKVGLSYVLSEEWAAYFNLSEHARGNPYYRQYTPGDRCGRFRSSEDVFTFAEEVYQQYYPGATELHKKIGAPITEDKREYVG